MPGVTESHTLDPMSVTTQEAGGLDFTGSAAILHPDPTRHKGHSAAMQGPQWAATPSGSQESSVARKGPHPSAHSAEQRLPSDEGPGLCPSHRPSSSQARGRRRRKTRFTSTQLHLGHFSGYFQMLKHRHGYRPLPQSGVWEASQGPFQTSCLTLHPSLFCATSLAA